MSFFSKFKKDYQDKKILIMGLGLLGRGVQDAAFFASLGCQVTVTDLKTKQQLKPSLQILKKYNINYVLGRHQNQDFKTADVIIRNPAVSLNSPYLKIARKNNIPIEMDDALFCQYVPVQTIGITGTRGKSTISTLIYQIIKQAGLSVYLAGNIMGKASLPLLTKVKKDDIVVLELSSWQLQGFKHKKISPDIAILTNIYEDHLNRYFNMQSYIKDKKTIFKFQNKKDYLVLNKEQKISQVFFKQAKSQVLWFDRQTLPKDWKLKLAGNHNQLNAGAAIKTAEILKIKKEIIKQTITNFKGLPYRLEKIATILQVDYINDTTSTTPIAAIKAIESFKKPIILIAGGNSKNLNMTELAEKISQKVNKVIFLPGSETDNLINLLNSLKAENKIVGCFNSLKKAVLKAAKIAKPGDVVLFSPGCTSFAMFENEYDRGDQFNKIVVSLK
jgi:UDP-N-acetylmuramoylalanine--D-glutamate ligase